MCRLFYRSVCGTERLCEYLPLSFVCSCLGLPQTAPICSNILHLTAFPIRRLEVGCKVEGNHLIDNILRQTFRSSIPRKYVSMSSIASEIYREIGGGTARAKWQDHNTARCMPAPHGAAGTWHSRLSRRLPLSNIFSPRDFCQCWITPKGAGRVLTFDRDLSMRCLAGSLVMLSRASDFAIRRPQYCFLKSLRLGCTHMCTKIGQSLTCVF